MTGVDPGGPDQAERGPDPFVVQLDWLVGAVGGQATLARRAVVAERSLRSWARGEYPKQNDSPVVRRLDAWAAANVADYPAAAGVPRLTETSGSAWRAAQPVATVPDAPGTTAPAPPEPATPGSRRPGRRRLAIAGGLAAAAAAVLVVGLLHPWTGTANGAGVAVLRSGRTAPSSAPLPTRGSGTPREEQTGSLGANTFADPNTLQDQALKIPPHTTVTVRCYVYAPSIPSVLPDGNWYLLETTPWTGRWVPANSFMNGDVPGGPTLHNTDFAVPKCR